MGVCLLCVWRESLLDCFDVVIVYAHKFCHIQLAGPTLAAAYLLCFLQRM